MGYTKADQAKHDEKMGKIAAREREAIESAKVEVEKAKTAREEIIRQKAEIKAKYEYKIERIKIKRVLDIAEIDKQIPELNKERNIELADIELAEEKLIKKRERIWEDFLLKYVEIIEYPDQEKLKTIIRNYKVLYSKMIESNEKVLEKFLSQQIKFAKLAETAIGITKVKYLLKKNVFNVRIDALQDSIDKLNHFFLEKGPAIILNSSTTNERDLDLELSQEMALLDYKGKKE